MCAHHRFRAHTATTSVNITSLIFLIIFVLSFPIDIFSCLLLYLSWLAPCITHNVWGTNILWKQIMNVIGIPDSCYVTKWSVRYRNLKDLMFNYSADSTEENSSMETSVWWMQASDVSLKGNKWAKEDCSEKSSQVSETKSSAARSSCGEINLQNKRTCEWLCCE